ncbi:cytochrome oxidase assembly protein ShyY1 [Agromyces sp. 3263]|uniref:SURF1 family protein n=1 Tax=Agromyces sp. 3263 TaxID=2817750 RepID=UPI002866250B|nr:SURF1 family protein [Agromyces sp. 3263]MDR6906747.1 cytochrome oxidase assembly protein ShyY1 [Agromyces sp. 3263]
MLRPRWVLALLLALGIAAAFALLGQWQLERAVEQAVVVERPTEEVRPLADVAQPDGPTLQASTGQRVEVSGTFVPGDTVVVEGRLNDGVMGYWPVAHLEVTDATPGGLPVALGWTDDLDTAREAAARFDADVAAGDEVTVVGRFLPSEAPIAPEDDQDPLAIRSVAVAQLINVWTDYDDRPVYFAYVTAAEPIAGLDAISSPPPEESVELNWLNIFYAVEWAVFAGFAIFLWYRLVRDAVERERDEAAEAEEATDAAEAARSGEPGAAAGAGPAGGDTSD